MLIRLPGCQATTVVEHSRREDWMVGVGGGWGVEVRGGGASSEHAGRLELTYKGNHEGMEPASI